jgi:hypothetical protein
MTSLYLQDLNKYMLEFVLNLIWEYLAAVDAFIVVNIDIMSDIAL